MSSTPFILSIRVTDMKVIIDRFEENIAVVELDGEMLNAPRALFEGAREGDTVEITVLPRNIETEISETPMNPDDSAPEDQGDESPAALFRKLRSKSKKRKR